MSLSCLPVTHYYLANKSTASLLGLNTKVTFFILLQIIQVSIKHTPSNHALQVCRILSNLFLRFNSGFCSSTLVWLNCYSSGIPFHVRGDFLGNFFFFLYIIICAVVVLEQCTQHLKKALCFEPNIQRGA